MDASILADTSILIDLQRGNTQTAAVFQTLYQKILLSRVTVSELVYGARNKIEKQENTDFISAFPILEISESISKLSYEIIDQYGLKVKLGIADSLIAATAIDHELLLWTDNTKHFTGIDNLQLYRP